MKTIDEQPYCFVSTIPLFAGGSSAPHEGEKRTSRVPAPLLLPVPPSADPLPVRAQSDPGRGWLVSVRLP
jgi:hypothetical protein